MVPAQFQQAQFGSRPGSVPGGTSQAYGQAAQPDGWGAGYSRKAK